MLKHKILEVKNKEEAVEKIKELYWSEEFAMTALVDIMPEIEFRGLSVEEVVEVYAIAFNEIEGDRTVRIYYEDLENSRFDKEHFWELY